MNSLPRNRIRRGNASDMHGGGPTADRRAVAAAAGNGRHSNHRHRRQPRLHQPARFPAHPRSAQPGRRF